MEAAEGGKDLTAGLAGELTPSGHRLVARVYFADTDFSGVVYHARYLEFFERGRSDFLRLAGVHHTELADGKHGEKLVWVVTRMEIDFRAPAPHRRRFDNTHDDAKHFEGPHRHAAGSQTRRPASGRCKGPCGHHRGIRQATPLSTGMGFGVHSRTRLGLRVFKQTHKGWSSILNARRNFPIS